MSSLVNNSNSNSALINTLNASNSLMNPNVYSIAPIYPASATIYQKTEKSSGNIGASQTISFDLMKYGIAQQLLLCYEKTTGGTLAYDFLSVLDRVELLSASKVIDTLTNYDLVSMFSDLDASQYNVVAKTVIDGRAPAPTNLYVIPLTFGFFKRVDTNLNLQFNEPMSIRVKFGANVNFDNAGGTTSLLSDCYLRLRYKAYNEADYSEILTQNYNESELSQLVTGYYDESIESVAVNAGQNNGINGTSIELKNTDCVNSFYVVVRTQSNTAPKPPFKIDRVKLTASGQEIFDLSGPELFMSKLCHNGYCVSGSDDPTQNVVKIQTGLWEYSGTGTQSNTMSLRELNNPKIQVFFTNTLATNETFDVVVCEDVAKIVGTVSSSGRVNTNLVN